MGKKKSAKIIEISRILNKICGAEGVRTLVQLCGKLCLLHAYFPLYFRDQTGRKPTLPFSLGTLSHDCTVPYNRQRHYFDAPDSGLKTRQPEGQKLANSKLGS